MLPTDWPTDLLPGVGAKDANASKKSDVIVDIWGYECPARSLVANSRYHRSSDAS